MHTLTPLRALGRLLPVFAIALATSVAAQGVDPLRMEAFAASLYERMDIDGDGRLTPEEYEHTEGGGFKVDYGLLDLDGDGAVTRKEYLLAVRRYHQPHGAKSI